MEYLTNTLFIQKEKIELLTGFYDDEKDKAETMEETVRLKTADGWVNFAWFLPNFDYRILETDYETFALIHSCNILLGWKWEWTWVLTR